MSRAALPHCDDSEGEYSNSSLPRQAIATTLSRPSSRLGVRYGRWGNATLGAERGRGG
jgi:hypothetical protein